MSDPAKREWRFYVDDMIAFAGKVLTYTEALDQAGFVASGLTYDATLRNLELIGEAANHIPESVRAAHSEIPWRMINSYPQSADSRLSRDRQRYPLEHHPRRCAWLGAVATIS